MEQSAQLGIFLAEHPDALFEVGEVVGFALAEGTLGLKSTCGLEGHVGTPTATHDADVANGCCDDRGRW